MICKIKVSLKMMPENNSMSYREEYSKLRLCGYSVNEKNGYSESERQQLLTQLIENRIITKNEIVGMLSILIETNGKSAQNYNAKIKWENDLKFVQKYNLNNQNKVTINDVKSASNRIII